VRPRVGTTFSFGCFAGEVGSSFVARLGVAMSPLSVTISSTFSPLPSGFPVFSSTVDTALSLMVGSTSSLVVSSFSSLVVVSKPGAAATTAEGTSWPLASFVAAATGMTLTSLVTGFVVSTVVTAEVVLSEGPTRDQRLLLRVSLHHAQHQLSSRLQDVPFPHSPQVFLHPSPCRQQPFPALHHSHLPSSVSLVPDPWFPGFRANL